MEDNILSINLTSFMKPYEIEKFISENKKNLIERNEAAEKHHNVVKELMKEKNRKIMNFCARDTDRSREICELTREYIEENEHNRNILTKDLYLTLFWGLGTILFFTMGLYHLFVGS